MVSWLRERLPGLRVHEYFHGRSWYLSLSHPQLLEDPKYGNRKTRLHHLLETHGLKQTAARKHVPEFVFRCNSQVRTAFLAGLLDADGCTAVSSKGSGVCFLTSTSPTLLEDVRRLCNARTGCSGRRAAVPLCGSRFAGPQKPPDAYGCSEL